MLWDNLPIPVLIVLILALFFYLVFRRYLKYKETLDKNEKNKEIELGKQKTEQEKQKTKQMKVVSNDLAKIIQSDNSVETASIIFARSKIESKESFDRREQMRRELTEEYEQMAFSTLQEVLVDESSRKATPVRQPENGKRIQSSEYGEGVKEIEYRKN